MRANKKDSDDKMKKFIEEFKKILAAITYWINTLKSSPTQRIRQSLRILPLWSEIIGELRHWTVNSLPKLVACGI